MISTATSVAFSTNDAYDRDMASDGRSRYGAYLRQKADMFRDGDDWTENSVRFALTAWQIAQSPIMAPGYVRSHPRVLHNCEHWDDEGRGALTIQLATALPTQVARSVRSLGWCDWERHDQRWVEPYDNDRPAAFASIFVRVPLSPDSLPAPSYHSRTPDTGIAQLAVHVICGLANDKVEPMLIDLLD
jgi:hypothetical protein